MEHQLVCHSVRRYKLGPLSSTWTPVEHQLVCHSVRRYKLGPLSSTWRPVEHQLVCHSVRRYKLGPLPSTWRPVEHQLVCHSVRRYKLGPLSSTWRTVEQQQVSNKFGNSHFCHTVEDRLNLMRSDLSVLYIPAATGCSWNWQKHWTQQQPKRCYLTSHHFSLFMTVSLLFKCCFVAWRRGFPWKFALCCLGHNK